jgi:hypothetical protein
MSKEDKVTLVNPRSIQHAQLGYESLLQRINIKPFDEPRFFKLFEEIQEYFGDKTQEKHLHRMILCSYLNNIDQFESLCKKMRGNSTA